MTDTSNASVLFAAALLVAAAGSTLRAAEADKPTIGIRGAVGHLANPKKVQRLSITKPGVYENYLVDGKWMNKNLVKINADNVTLRHCEIKNGKHNGVTVYSRNVLIESCRIHHFLKGRFKPQQDAHGITGRPNNLTIRNCEIFIVSGDAVQFDPGRGSWDNVTIESCTFWTWPLKFANAGFKAGQRPGENALDTKSLKKHPRARITLRNCYFYGWGDGQIRVQAALNLKENIKATVENCVIRDSEIGFRLRGDTGKRGGALVNISDCAVYDCKIAVRMEDGIRDLKITNLGIAGDVKRKYQTAKGVGPGLKNTGEFVPPPLEDVLAKGVKPAAARN